MTELVLWGAFAAFAFTARFALSLASRRRRRTEWAAAAAASGLTEVATSGTFLGDHLRARAGSLELTVDARALSEAWRKMDGAGSADAQPSGHVRIAITGLSPGVGLAPEKGGLWSRPDARELQVGDPDFDPRVLLQGPPALLLALLDAPTRALVVQAMLRSITVADGRLRAVLDDRYAGGGAGSPLSLMLPALLRLAERLRQPSDLAVRLAEHVREEPLDEVRLWNLATLAREYPEHPETRAALRHACGDRYDELRLRAALMVGDEGRDVLLEFARGDRGDDHCAARAVEALGDALAAGEVEALLEEAIREARPLTARALVSRLGRTGGASALRTLAGVLSGDDGDLAEAAATALGSGGTDGEGALVGALAHRLDFVRAAAARALGRVGTTAAVEPLREAEADHPRDAKLRRQAREAVAAIQARTGATPGRLSLAAGAPGQVSFATDESGRVSFPERR